MDTDRKKDLKVKHKKNRRKNEKKEKMEATNTDLKLDNMCNQTSRLTDGNGSESGSSTDSEDLVNAINYNTITSLAALKDIIQGDNNDTPETDSFFQHYFMNHCNNLSSRNIPPNSPFPYTERRRLSQCREEDEEDDKRENDPPAPILFSEIELGKPHQSISDILAKELSLSDGSEVKRSNAEKDKSPDDLYDNEDDHARLNRTIMGAKHKFLVTTTEPPLASVERALRSHIHNAHTVHFGTKGAEEQRPSMRSIFTGQNLHRDKNYFDSSLIEIRSTVDEIPTSSEDIWVKRTEDKTDAALIKQTIIQDTPASITNNDTEKQNEKPETNETEMRDSKTSDKSTESVRSRSGTWSFRMTPKEKDALNKIQYRREKDLRRSSDERRQKRDNRLDAAITRSSQSVGERKRRGSNDDGQPHPMYQQTIHGTSGVSRRPALFDIFKSKPKTGDAKKQSSIMQQVKAAVQSITKSSGGSSTKEVKQEPSKPEASTSSTTPVVKVRDGSAHKHAGSDTRYYHTLTASSSRRPSAMAKVMEMFRGRSSVPGQAPPTDAAEKRKARALAQQQHYATAGIAGGFAQARYYGKDLGPLSQLHHGVRGRVYAVDSKTLFIQDFHYDGEGPAAYFYVGKSKSPDAAGATRLRDERGGAGALRRYRGEPVTISLSDGLTLKDIRWFSVWCDEYAVNFGDVSIPRDLDFPKPAKVGALRGIHGVSSDQIIVVDAQTLLITNFSYDGEAPDAKFWVGRGDQPSPQGIRIPDENGKEDPLRKYDKKTIVLTLPGDLTVFDIGHFGVWCEAFTVDFGHITLPRAQVSNVPPSLKMLGVSPQSKLNCEVLNEEFGFEVRWAIAGDSIVLQLVAKLDDGEYMSFGISGHPSRVQMVGGDVAVAWVDKDSFMGYSKDYYLDAKSQCAGVRGTCPDERIVSKTNSVRVLNAALVNGYSIVTYQRSLRAADELDLPIFTNTSQPVIWAIGPLNSRLEASYHHTYLKEDKFIEFGRPPMWDCPMPESEDEGVPSAVPIAPGRQHTHEHTHKHREPVRPESTAVIKPNPVPTPKPVAKVVPWEIPPIQCYEPSDGVFYAQMGPTGGKHGYSAITGHVGWGISWYINGLLIPEINVVRGKQYTFVVEGGSNPEIPAKYHPFYITNDPVGGYYHKSEEERKGIQIYAGARRLRSGEVTPTGVGRICNWTPDSQGPEADEYPSFGAYQRSLTLVCETGDPGVVTWTPDRNTPDTVYYQCFTHRHLGWKINVLDECDVEEAEESRVVESLALPDDLQSQESIQVQSRVAPDGNILDQRKKIEKIMHTKMNYNDFSSYKDGELTGEVYRDDRHRYKNGQEYELPISNNQIKEVIQTVESLESKMKDEIKKNVTHPQQVHQYQVHENVKEMFMPELPIREEDEYFVETGKSPQNYLLPPNQKPLTLQSVLRPTGLNRVVGNMRPHFRRPAPPEIKLRRPPPMHHKVNPYPLPMPNPHNSHGMKKPSPSAQPNHKQPNNRPMPLNRPLLPNIPPMKTFSPPHINKPLFSQIHQHMLKNDPNPTHQTPLSIITANNKQGPNNMHLPVQTLSVGQSDIIVNQVVKSQITLPGSNDAIAQHSIPQPYHKSGQIILGKPMEHPVPLDQQMIQTKPHVTRTPSTPQPQFFQTSNPRVKLENELLPQNVMKSSDFIGESVDSSTLPPAMNTGFKPDSIVVESGFKPIIREPLMAGEDRIAEYDGNSNRREDTNVEEDYEESPQPIANHKVPSEKMTETFEPMFIPSPPDHLLPTNDRTKEVFPKNHAKEDRPHPVYVKKESELNALFGKKNMAKDVPTDMVMESNRVSPHYLPPDPKLPKEHSQKLSMNEQTFTTYDGKTVSADTLTSVPNLNKTTTKFSAKLPANSELLLKTPQFGPFKGEIPPPVAADIIKSSSSNFKSGSSDDVKTTHLKLVNLHKPEKSDVEDLVAHGSEKHEVTEDGEEFEEEEEEEYEDEEDEKRSKRDTKATHFEKGEAVEQKPTNGHSLPMNQIDYESVPSSGYKMRLQCISILVVLIATRIIRF